MPALETSVRVALFALVASTPAWSQSAKPVLLDSTTKFALKNARIQSVDYRGRRALKVAPLVGHERDTDQEMVAVLSESDFKDGAIEIDVAGSRRAGYSTTADSTGFKGIVGLSFRVRGDSAERFYIRPENSRQTDQLYRNRSTQYESDPDFPWNKLRAERPGVYESYVDIESGAWTRLRVVVSGTKAQLYVNGATQPCLIVNDLKLGSGGGKIALWARISTEAYFSNLRLTR